MEKWKIDNTWSLFLDRDGVINVRILGGYIKKVEEFKFLPKVPESIAELSNLFGHVFVVTNQQGIGKGLMTESNLSDIHDYMRDEISKLNGRIDRVYHAPKLAEENDELRKPRSGMALKAKEHFPLVLFEKSIMVGDSDSDILFGQNLGMKTVRIKTIEPITVHADLTIDSLDQLINYLEK